MKRFLKILQLVALTSLVATFVATEAYATDGRKVAMIIGNSGYPTAPLFNPVNDARAVASAFESMQFDSVVSVLDATRADLEKALDDFSITAKGSTMAVIYYAGHGIQVDGENYIIPVDIDVRSRRDINRMTKLSELLTETSQASDLGLVILDACRDNPFAYQLDEHLGRGLVGRGLARQDSLTGNSLVAFATSADSIAEDGSGKHSPYTNALLKHIATPNIDVRQMFGKVRDDVIRDTAKRQRPFVYGSLGGKSLFLHKKEDRPGNEFPAHNAGQQLDFALWNSAEKGGTAEDFQVYIDLSPDGAFVSFARLRIESLNDSKPLAIAATKQTPANELGSEQGVASPVDVLSSKDIQNAAGRFIELSRAIESKDYNTVQKLTNKTRSRSLLLESLFESFEKIDVSLGGIEASRRNQAVSGILRINKLHMADGEMVVPPTAFREIRVTTLRRQGQWSSIQW